MKVLALSFVLCVASVLAQAGLNVAAGAPANQATHAKLDEAKLGVTSVARGEYEVYEEGSSGAVGPFGEEVYGFHEAWVLTRKSDGSYHLKGERRFRTHIDGSESVRPFSAELSRDLTVLSVTEFSRLKWIADSGPLTCEFLTTEMHCSIGGQQPHPASDRHIDVEHPYGLLWPISPFSLASVVKESERDPSVVTRASLVSIEQPSPENPVSPMVLTGEAQYLGEETISAAGRFWQARKFSIKVPLHPKFIVWTSEKGILLALTVEHQRPDWPNEGLRLVQYEAFGNF